MSLEIVENCLNFVCYEVKFNMLNPYCIVLFTLYRLAVTN